MNDCNCFVARHREAAEIGAELLRGDDPRDVAQRYGIGKTKVYEHKKHLLTAALSGPEDAAAGAAEPTPAPAPGSPVAPPAPPAERPAERRRGSAERAETRVEPGGTGLSPSVQVTAGPARARPAPGEGDAARSVPGAGYLQAIDTCLGLITERRWRPNHIRALAEKYGISVDRARHAYHEATRHLQLDMGGYVQKQATSATWTAGQRDDARGRADSATTNAERWRRQEREAQDAADKLTGKERFAMLQTSAHLGLLATKYDLAAEKWSAQALAHQRHLDDVLCLRAPKEMHLTQNNIGVDSAELVDRLATALAQRFADRPEIVTAIEEAAAALEAGSDAAPLNEDEAAA